MTICAFCSRRAKRRCSACARDLCANHSKMLSTMTNPANVNVHRCAGCATATHIREWLVVGARA